MELGAIVIIFLIAAFGTLGLGLVFKWVDRKVTAMVQWRVGPPIYQPLVDIIKLMGKENMMPHTAAGTGFLLAPVVGLAAAAEVSRKVPPQRPFLSTDLCWRPRSAA